MKYLTDFRKTVETGMDPRPKDDFYSCWPLLCWTIGYVGQEVA